jgi:hypothetical protein
MVSQSITSLARPLEAHLGCWLLVLGPPLQA